MASSILIWINVSMVFLILIFAGYNIKGHFTTLRYPLLQSFFIWIILAAPIFSLMSLCRILDPDSYIPEVITLIFEALITYFLWNVMVIYGGGTNKVLERIETTTIQFRCCKNIKTPRKHYEMMKTFVIQWIFTLPFGLFVKHVLNKSGNHTSWVILYNVGITIMVVRGFLGLFRILKPYLIENGAIRKLIVKFFIGILVLQAQIGYALNNSDETTYILSTLTIIEALIFSFLSLRVYGVKQFVNEEDSTKGQFGPSTCNLCLYPFQNFFADYEEPMNILKDESATPYTQV